MYLIGYDIGSSSVKATLMEAQTGDVVASATYPKVEMEINAKQAGWAEQDPQAWWSNIILATAEIKSKVNIDIHKIEAIGITYQMHGLVIVDKEQNVLRPSIIWCDSRAVEIGEKAFNDIGGEKCLEQFLNSPGNFTASKLKWVKENEPELYAQIHKAMLPGDYIAMKMSGEIQTTVSGLSEGILWDYKSKSIANDLLDYYGIDADLWPDIVDTFSVQCELNKVAAEELGLAAGTKISYRAGDQPNNAFSLNVLNPGEIAATAGTSGVVYGINEKPNYDPESRVNTFVHVNHTEEAERYGVLLCVNGTGIQNSWLRANIVDADKADYVEMNKTASSVPIGSDGVVVLPYGNGAERSLINNDIGAQICNINFNVHNNSHVLRAAQEGIVFALNYGFEIMKTMDMDIRTVKAGDANMFLSPIFRETFANITGATVELYNTDGSQGAARGAGIGAGIYKDASEAFDGLKTTKVIEPDSSLTSQYQEAYATWLYSLNKFIK